MSPCTLNQHCTTNEAKSCMFVRNKSDIFILNHCFRLNNISIIHNIAFTSERPSYLNQKRNMHKSSTVYEQKQYKTNSVWILMWQQRMHFFIGWSVIRLWTHIWARSDRNWWTGVVWIIVMLLSAVWTLILTAPIHCRASTAETLTYFSKSDEETNSSTSRMIWEWGIFQPIKIFDELYL